MTALRTFALVGATLALSMMGGCMSPLVGLECRDGLERCGSACYDLQSSDQHCGGCDIACGVAEQCVQSACVPRTGAPDAGDGGAPDGARDAQGDARIDIDAGDAASEGGAPDGSDLDGNLNPDAHDPDGALDPDATMNGDGGDASIVVPPPPLCTGAGSPLDCVCGLGQTKCEPALTCVDTASDRSNCGGCGIVCDAIEYCNQGLCDPICAAPVELCGTECVNTDTDENNCGTCGNVCAAAAACIEGSCVGAAIGHVVVVGHDMSVVRAQIRQMVGNAVFLMPRAAGVRVLFYEANTSNASKVGITTSIAGAALGRLFTIVPAAPDSVTQQLANADVFVIGPQQGANDADLTSLGVAWSAALHDFLTRGGVIVLFDGGPDSGDMNLGTWQILKAATAGSPPVPLLDATGTTLLSQRILSLVAPADAIAAGVSNQYQSQGETVGFNLASTPADQTTVVADTLGGAASNLPVVLHIIREPTITP